MVRRGPASPLLRGIIDGATTMQSSPNRVRCDEHRGRRGQLRSKTSGARCRLAAGASPASPVPWRCWEICHTAWLSRCHPRRPLYPCAIVSLCTSMPMNWVGCSMTRLLHARPSGATLDHAHGEMGHPFRAATDHRGKGAQADVTNTVRSVPRDPALAGSGQSPGLTSFLDSPGPETDMRSIARDMAPCRCAGRCIRASRQGAARAYSGGSPRSPKLSS